jgi:hypothetical protein
MFDPTLMLFLNYSEREELDQNLRLFRMVVSDLLRQLPRVFLALPLLLPRTGPEEQLLLLLQDLLRRRLRLQLLKLRNTKRESLRKSGNRGISQANTTLTLLSDSSPSKRTNLVRSR